MDQRMALRLAMLLSLMLSVLHIGQAEQPVEVEPMVTRTVQLLGGWASVSPEKAEIQDAAKKALENFNTKSKAKKYFKLINVTSAKTQVTNVINYKMEATVGKTKCHKSENVDMETCDLAKKKLFCKFEVQFDPRNDQHEVKNYSCQKKKKPFSA